MSRADLGKDPDEVSAMFDGVARRYDLLNDLLSLGRTKAWRKIATATINPKPGMKILDIAAGTGSSSRPLADAGAEVTPLDFSKGMLAAGKKRHPDLNFTFGDALNLPFKDGEFDITTIINTHDMNSVMEIGDNILFISEGQKCWQGNSSQIFNTMNKKLNAFVFASPFSKKFREIKQMEEDE